MVDEILGAIGAPLTRSDNGVALALGLTGVMAAAALLAGRNEGSFSGEFSAGPMKGSFRYEGSRATRWNDYVGKRVPELMEQGHSAHEAMRAAADEYHGRS